MKFFGEQVRLPFPNEPKRKRKDSIVDAGFLAEIFAVTDRTVRNWAADGMPQIGHGKFDLAACVQWKIAQAAIGVSESAAPGSTDEARLDLYIAQRQRIEMDIAERRRGLVPAALVARVMAEQLSIVDREIVHLPFELALQLAAVNDPPEVQGLIFAAARHTRAAIAASVRDMAGRLELGSMSI